MGYGPSLFWDSSLQEIYDFMESYGRQQQRKSEEYTSELKSRALLNSVLAKQIGEYVACMFNKDATVTPIHEWFPTLFSKEEFEEQNQEVNMALYKAQMEDFAFRHNSKLLRKEE